MILFDIEKILFDIEIILFDIEIILFKYDVGGHQIFSSEITLNECNC